jgi:very-short-patch-repair endonuclease
VTARRAEPPQPPAKRDDHLRALAAAQHGVVTRKQLLEAGFTTASVRRRVANGWLKVLHRGVYQVGPVPAAHGGEMAAVLACGPHAVLSHRSAAALWKLPAARATDRSAPAEVSVRQRDHRRRPGIRVYRPLALGADEVTTFARIPVTTPARTLLDLAGVERAKFLERALAEALVQNLTTEDEISKLLGRYPNRPGATTLRSLLAQNPETAFARSEAERRFRELVQRAELPRPEGNARVLGRERDFVWRAQRLVVEVDGFRYHSRQDRFENDKRRDADLVAAGFRPLRFTWRQIEEMPEYVVARVAQALVR